MGGEDLSFSPISQFFPPAFHICHTQFFLFRKFVKLSLSEMKCSYFRESVSEYCDLSITGRDLVGNGRGASLSGLASWIYRWLPCDLGSVLNLSATWFSRLQNVDDDYTKLPLCRSQNASEHQPFCRVKLTPSSRVAKRIQLINKCQVLRRGRITLSSTLTSDVCSS